MAPVQARIENELRNGDLSINDLVRKIAVEQNNSISEQEVRSAVLPMISSSRVELTPAFTLHLRR